jgi:hypothetical protein
MNITRAWMVLTEGEKMAVLQYAVYENAKKWKRQ